MKKTKYIVVRINECQFKKLADALIDEERSKSEILRNALDLYLEKGQGYNNSENFKSINGD